MNTSHLLITYRGTTRPLTEQGLDQTLNEHLLREIALFERKFNRARNRMVKLKLRNHITELHDKMKHV